MLKRFRVFVCSGIALTALAPIAGLAGEPVDYVSTAELRLRNAVTYLADDDQEGRGPGTGGLAAAGEYLAEQFRLSGLAPAKGANGYFQDFEIEGDPALDGEATATLAAPGSDGPITLTPGEDFQPLGLGGSADLSGVPIVFAGYGITAKDSETGLDYDDFKDLDVEGKVVLMLRREPRQDDETSPFAGTEASIHAALRTKARNAAKQNAAAVILVNDAASLKDEPDTLSALAALGGGGTGMPFLMVKREVVDRLLAQAQAPSLAELEARIDETLKPTSQVLEGCTLSARYEITRKPFAVRNVVAVLEGEGPDAEETIVVGAHYDHLGFGGAGSLAGTTDIHNGADDNASGTAMVLELARRMARRGDPLPRRLVFMAFSGEERGLLGSKHYVENPLYPLENTVAMINFDMVGRLNDANELTLYGAPSGEGMEELVTRLAESQGLKPNVVAGSGMQFGASDHASFYYKDIPVLFAFTGIHSDYHRPSDDSNLINYDGMDRIANFGELVLLDLALRPDPPRFVKLSSAATPVMSREGGTPMPYMGTRPAYGESDVQGVALEGVSEGGPAEKAGIKGGDVIIGFGGEPIADIEEFMTVLSKHKPGDVVEVKIQREGKEQTVSVTLGTRDGSE